MGAASAVPSPCAISAPCARTAIISGWSSPEPGTARPQRKRKRRRSLVDRHRFEQLVAEALASIPRRFRDAMKNLAIVVEDEPSSALLNDMEIEPPDTLLGLY